MHHGHAMQQAPPHGHSFYELIFITGGQGQHRIGESVFTAEERTVFVIPPGVIHDCRRLGNADGWSVLFLPESIQEPSLTNLGLIHDVPTGLLFDVFRRPVLQLTRPLTLELSTYRHMTGMLSSMAVELRDKPVGYEYAVRATLQLMLIGLARCAPWLGEPAGQVAAHPEHRDLMTAVFRDIDWHYPEDSTLTAAGQRLGFNPNYLTTRIKQLTGRTYGEWVIERKMIEARHLLATSQLTVSKIAERLGYSEIESFVRRFRHHHSTTPSAWRKEALGRVEISCESAPSAP
ncbi:AraC family transcriptional regulator [Salinisphaera hydrothermalis]|uniref:AraC family transcriptional regulator n=1 Tax=Salinisphaera hydrothermalis TaxID=563188 RepID=UPI0033406BEA